MKEEPDISTIEPLYKIFNFITQPIAVASANGNIEWINSYFLRFFKTGSKPSNINELIELPESLDSSGLLIFSDKINSNVFIQPVQNKNSIEYIILLDSKDSKQLEKDFLNQKLKGFAHDLNNILSNILNGIDVLKSRISTADENYELIENLTNNSNKAIEIVSSLLNLDNNPIVQKRRVSIKTLLRDLHRAFKISLPENINLNFILADDLKNVYGNYTNLYSSILNLCVNAKESIKGTGEITIRAVSKTVEKELTAVNGTMPEGDYVLIEVQDTGEGLKEDQLTKIFERGFTTKTKEYQGGIGLDNVKNIITEHNGFITVESQPGEGTKFSIYLPIVKDYELKNSNSDKTIMITEDEEALAGLLSDLFESYDYKVITAKNGKETLRKLAEGVQIDLLLIDKELPDINGIDCIKAIRDKNLTFPIILATGSIDEEDKIFGEKFANSYLQKPYNFDKALTVVRELIG